ncbi:MAG: hypothetical protein JW829_10730 [Pirellulales bacterium]|nr:hypothetical protein [Pirellulales bacterium]
MSQITQCTACRQQLAIPPATGSSNRLMCPLCHAEFTLADTSVATLPDAILLDQDPLGSETALEEEYELGDVGLAHAHHPEGGGDSSMIDDVPDDSIDQAVMDEEVPGDSALDHPVEEQEFWDFDEAPDEQQQVAVGPAIRENDPFAARMIIRTAALGRPRKSALRQLIGFVGGGVIGLALGYYILLWIGGPDRDFLELGEKLPVWMVPKAFHETEPDVAQTFDSVSNRDEVVSGDDWTGDPIEPDTGLEGTSDVPRTAEETISSENTYETSNTKSDRDQTTTPGIFDPGTAIPKPPAPLGLRDIEPVTSDELAAAIDAATAARDPLIEGDLTDKVNQPKKGKNYIVYCKLAEALTRIADSTGIGLGSEQAGAGFQPMDWKPLCDAARELLAGTIRSEKTRLELGTIAQKWLDNPYRDNQGILLVEKAMGPYPCAPYSGLQFAFDGVPRTIPIVSSEPLPYQEGDPIVVMGMIIDDPAARLLRFTQTPPRIVFTRMIFRAD